MTVVSEESWRNLERLSIEHLRMLIGIAEGGINGGHWKPTSRDYREAVTALERLRAELKRRAH